MAPTRLNHSHLRISEKVDGALEQVRLRHKIGIENANEFAGGGLEANSQCAGFESGTIHAVNQLDIEPARPQFLGTRDSNFACVVCRIVEHLDLEPVARIIEPADRAQEPLHHVDFIKDRQLHCNLGQLLEAASRHWFALPVLKEKVNDEITMDSVRRETDEHGEITGRPNHVAEASLHEISRSCQLLRQHGRMMAFPRQPSNQKWAAGLLKTASFPTLSLSILIGIALTLAATNFAQEEPLGNREHQREELGVNPYTAPSIARIFQQLDELKPLPFEKLKRDFPSASQASREQKGLIFGGFIADGFLIVEAEKKNLIEDFGRTLLREARSLGVGDRVTRHSTSLTELGRRGNWALMRKELIATQADVEQAMIELRDEKMAHLISLGGWLRGLEISAEVVEADFSPGRAKVLAQPDLVNYFTEELRTLPPPIMHAPLFEKIRAGMGVIRTRLDRPESDELTLVDVKAIHAQARELNLAIQQVQ